ncbi:hypothetical protein [Polaribacter sp. IC063]|uniref:hypothetical protein n=1 Tax=Polaribacter sp. IC063 TaxID=57031 RepID=UPI0011BFD92E|nr:hypothetical protein [Polaribacter sp. IC063]TXD53090.1 hypothetical protein ES043_06040 [Polaribacter sp. IC063]
MNKTNLLASVTLFGELYNSETYKSIPDILAELIKGAIISENTFSFNSTELKKIMNKVYGFEIPESVLRTVLKSKFKDKVKIEHKIYHFEQEVKEGFESFDKNVELIIDKQNEILNQLYSYIEEKQSIKLDNSDKSKLFNNFSNYLLDNDFSEKYSDLISGFLVSKENDVEFKMSLNSIREGLILYQGINYTDNITQLGHWNTELTIYLSTEHLFSCVGFNGLLYQEIFDDFFKLVLEINQAEKKKELIQLKYLKETKDEVDYFFSSAESIKKGYKKLDPTKLAMVNILKNCDSPRDIKRKQVKFYEDLKRKGIEFKSFEFDIDKSEYNVVDESLVDELKEISESKNRTFNENYCFETLRIFTKINSFRRGNNGMPFEKIRHIYITENGFAKFLAHNEKVKFGNYDIPFAKDIDFITSKFWFKLKKGFSNKNELPKSFDVITKAKIIISSHLNTSLTQEYYKIQSDYKSGKITESEASSLNLAFRETPSSPEKITFENIDSSLDFLFDDNIQENILRERTKNEELLSNTIEEKNELEKRLQKFEQQEFEKEEKERIEALEKAKENFASNEWATHRKFKFKEMKYFLRVTFVTVLPIVLGLIFKIIKPINNYIESLGEYKYFVWGGLILIFFIETFGRSYIFNKTKVKNGWLWLKTFSSGNYGEYKEQKIIEYKKNYNE